MYRIAKNIYIRLSESIKIFHHSSSLLSSRSSWDAYNKKGNKSSFQIRLTVIIVLYLLGFLNFFMVKAEVYFAISRSIFKEMATNCINIW